MLLHEAGVLDALLPQTEFQHLDAANEILINVLLRRQLTLQLAHFACHLTLFEKPLGFLREVVALHVLQRANYLVQLNGFGA